MSLVLSHISMSYGKTQVLRDISVTIGQGEFLSVLGHSGCGKTTLLKILAGFERPTGGSLSLDGKELASPSFSCPVEKRDLGMVFQSFALWPHMTVAEHAAFPLRCKNGNLSRAERDARVEEVLRTVGLEKLADRYPDELSGGQKQRVSLARAIAPRPSLLLMDEPLSALDADLRVSMRKEIQRLHRLTGATVVFVTHDQNEALSLSDRILVLNEGRIEQLGSPREIYLYPQTEFIASFIGRCNFFKGEWEGNVFRAAEGAFLFQGDRVSETFRARELCPIRPEELRLGTGVRGLPAVVVEKQYNGREIHYLLSSRNESYTVYAPASEDYPVGEEVVIYAKAAV